jgi:hypothetical protein
MVWRTRSDVVAKGIILPPKGGVGERGFRSFEVPKGWSALIDFSSWTEVF